MKKLFALILALCLLTGCAETPKPEKTSYTATFLDLFDTVTTVVGYGDSKEAFEAQAQQIYEELAYYHDLFDIYNPSQHGPNLWTVNENAGISPVQVAPEILELLTDCKTYYELTDGRVNVAMGAVLRLWHEARSRGINDPASAKLPSAQALEAAAAHTDMDCMVLDPIESTVYLTDPEMSLDVGAIAKGWATQKVAQDAPRGMLISVGGNVCATGPKPGNKDWVIGIQNPNGGAYLHTVYVSAGSVVTSGDYQRTYWVEGKPYNHIIDPDTRMPGTLYRSVSVICPDSGLADALSTALFLLPLEQGMALAQSCGAEALWLDVQGQEHMTPGFEALIRN